MAFAAKKVILLPPELVRAFQQKEDHLKTGVLTKVKQQLDCEMEKILASDLPTTEKLQLYNETLQKFMNLNQQPALPQKLQIDPPTESVKPVESATPRVHATERIPMAASSTPTDYADLNKLIATFPIKLRNKAKQLLNSGVDWNELGEWLVDSTPVVNSNIIDLVNYTIRVSKPTSKPVGLAEFTTYLSDFDNAANPTESQYNLGRWHSF